MAKTYYANAAIENGAAVNVDANYLPGDVVELDEKEAQRLLDIDAIREATDEDVAIAKTRNRYREKAVAAPAPTTSVKKPSAKADETLV